MFLAFFDLATLWAIFEKKIGDFFSFLLVTLPVAQW
jgi:hypothetical protein